MRTVCLSIGKTNRYLQATNNNLDKKKSSIATELNTNSSEKSNKGELLKKLNEISEFYFIKEDLSTV